jgi:hypothetical protein
MCLKSIPRYIQVQKYLAKILISSRILISSEKEYNSRYKCICFNFILYNINEGHEFPHKLAWKCIN